MFAATYAPLEVLNIMQLHSSAERYFKRRDFQCADHHRADTAGDERRSYKPLGASKILQRNLLIYGVGGIIVPFIGIKIIDVLLVALGLA